MNKFSQIFNKEWPLIGMVHLPPLPGSPGYMSNMEQVIDFALGDARTLAESGFDGLMIENFNDVPFYPDRVPAETVAAMTRIISEIKSVVQLPLGVNVLRNDGLSALAIAAAVGASFVRINVFAGVTTSEQGWLVGKAHEIARYKKSLNCDALVLADVDVKHAYPIVNIDLESQIHDVVSRCGADGVIVSGGRTGLAPHKESLKAAHTVCQKLNVPLLVGSGLSKENFSELCKYSDGAIVGSALKQKIDEPINPNLAADFVQLANRG